VLSIGERLEEVFTSPLTYVSIVAAVGGIMLAYYSFYKPKISAEKVVAKGFPKAMHQLLLDRYKFPVAYDKIGYAGLYGFSLLLDKFDRYVIDGIVNGIQRLPDQGGRDGAQAPERLRTELCDPPPVRGLGGPDPSLCRRSAEVIPWNYRYYPYCCSSR